ncbi:Bud site selection protein 6 [Cytospora mali]|uniref:Bud site selection protein 6 n=1 Tax=Cytospora mali TaxID=578113 RepID=A0A194V9V0_CYTMA|nr:Bud site selection protein 6 [Valsa mali var. pyri (nom. inval.)]
MRSQRSMRRSPGAEPGPPPNVPIRSISPAVGITGSVQPRASTASNRSNDSIERHSGSTKRPSFDEPFALTLLTSGTLSKTSSGSSAMPLSQIEKSVTHLLVATKQLLETLTQWSRNQASDTQVSDVYVRLGYEFNMACRAFTAINVDTSDLGNVPELLRHILEATLSQEASVESLEKYLPRIRDIIINLLHGLKRKQQKLRQKQARDKDNGEPSSGRINSTSTNGSASGLSAMLNEGLENNGYRPGSRAGPDDITNTKTMSGSPRRFLPQRDDSQATISDNSLSSETMQNIPVVPPYPSEDSIPAPPPANELDNFPPPPPPPKSSTQSALAALQRGGDLERRASRRYSQYQISKHLGSGANGLPMLPPQNTPIPNRGRGEVRESMRAVQVRETLRKKNNEGSISARPGSLVDSSSPQRAPSRISEEKEDPRPDSPVVQSPEENYKPSATLKGPLLDVVPPIDDGDITPTAEAREEVKPAEQKPVTPTPEQQGKEFALDQSPQSSSPKELTLFLQYKSRVKKFVLQGGHSELSIGRLQLAFIEKFSWNTHANGSDLPEIYIQDPVSGVRHELEDLSDIKDRSVLVLNVEALDEIKKHVDDGLGSIRQLIELVKQNVDEQGTALKRVSERQQEAAKEMARLAAAPPTPPADSPRSRSLGPVRKLKGGQGSEIQGLRRDLAVLRQTYTNFQSDVEGSMNMIRNKANNVKAAAAKASIPDVEGGSGHAYVTKGRKQLNTDSDRLVNKVDDLQDLVEDLRKDVVHRGVRPRPRQLETVAKDIQAAMKELKKMEEYMKREKPVWTKIWEKELEDVCTGRDEVKLMEDLMADLQDDLEKANETFALVEQATKEQMKDVTTGQANVTLSRQFSKGLTHIVANIGADPTEAKEGVLGEVRALQPNHEDRMEAIERAEKLRQKDLETRNQNPIKKELTEFVAEGKLKKSGGFEELERQRQAKEDRIRKERCNGVTALTHS